MIKAKPTASALNKEKKALKKPMPQSQGAVSIKKDTHSYQGYLNSDSFIKRSMGVLGYNTIGTLLIYVAMIVIGVIFVILTAIASFIF